MTLLQHTHQTWKITLFTILFLAGCAATLLQGFLYGPLGRELVTQIAFAGVGVIVGSVVWAVLSVTCPQCQLKLFVHAFRSQGFFSWFVWLMQVEACPKCRFGEAPPAPSRRKRAKGFKRP